jgi:hypothetical protein
MREETAQSETAAIRSGGDEEEILCHLSGSWPWSNGKKAALRFQGVLSDGLLSRRRTS